VLNEYQADGSGHVDLGMVLRNGSWSMIRNGGGTSASAPIWAALIALADQYAGHHLGFVNPAIYQIARGVLSRGRAGRLPAARHAAVDNEPSRRVILANGGAPGGQAGGEDRFWISLGRE
jgi:hypothetical protein